MAATIKREDTFVLSGPSRHISRDYEPKVPPTPPVHVSDNAKLSDKEFNRQSVICEIINTERDYGISPY